MRCRPRLAKKLKPQIFTDVNLNYSAGLVNTEIKGNQPRISIGMPVYNGDRFLEAALDSILAQTFRDFELIISDNASTDRTQEICRNYAAKDERIRYYRNEQNLGGAWNFNRVFELSKGEYFRWACYDDLCAPELLERCTEVLNRDPSVILCYPKTILIDGRGRFIENCVDDLSLTFSEPHERYQCFHQHYRYGARCNVLFGVIRASVLKKTPLIGSYPSSDILLLAELTLLGKYYEVPEYLFFRRDHPETSVRGHNAFRTRMAWYDPAKKGKLHLTRWKWLFEYLAGIRRVPMNRGEKVRCYLQIVKWFRWNWVWLAKDLVKGAAWPLLHPFLNFEFNQLESNQHQKILTLKKFLKPLR